jgi:hypothetical protein
MERAALERERKGRPADKHYLRKLSPPRLFPHRAERNYYLRKLSLPSDGAVHLPTVATWALAGCMYFRNG